MKIPHLVQYQGSKRALAQHIIKFFPEKFNRLIEPFSGSAAISLACAYNNKNTRFLINDLNPVLINLLDLVVKQPEYVSKEYKNLWEEQHKNTSEHYKIIRNKFNLSRDPIMFLYLLARCVKGSVRYNSQGEFNQGADKRRFGTAPDKMKNNIYAISFLLKNKSEFMSKDYRETIEIAKKGDLIYMDPPYQGVCGNKNSRYYSGIDFERFTQELDKLNAREIDYVISYDGKCGDRIYGEKLPKYLDLKHILIDAGRSSQATLLGRKQITIESLYISKKLFNKVSEHKNITFLKPIFSNLDLLEVRCA